MSFKSAPSIIVTARNIMLILTEGSFVLNLFKKNEHHYLFIISFLASSEVDKQLGDTRRQNDCRLSVLLHVHDGEVLQKMETLE